MSSQRSSAVATVMFTDVEASTDLTTREGDLAAAAVFDEHDRIVRDRVTAHRGRIVRSTGDGFLAIFDSAGDAVGCAESIQRDLAAQVDGIRVRIGLNTGEVFQADGEVFGAAVNLAARVMDRARGGQVLVTETVRQAAGTMPDARFRDRGRVALKGFPGRQRLFEVGASVGRPRRAAARRRHPAVLAAATAVAVAAAAAATLAMTGGEGDGGGSLEQRRDPRPRRRGGPRPGAGRRAARRSRRRRRIGLGRQRRGRDRQPDRDALEERCPHRHPGHRRRRAGGGAGWPVGRGRRARSRADDRPGVPQRRALAPGRAARDRATCRGGGGRRLDRRRLGQPDRAAGSADGAARRDHPGRQRARAPS